MKIGDCFLVKGSTFQEPMTIYHILDMDEKNILALSICIKEEEVQGLDIPSEYDNDIPEDAL